MRYDTMAHRVLVHHPEDNIHEAEGYGYHATRRLAKKHAKQLANAFPECDIWIWRMREAMAGHGNNVTVIKATEAARDRRANYCEYRYLNANTRGDQRAATFWARMECVHLHGADAPAVCQGDTFSLTL